MFNFFKGFFGPSDSTAEHNNFQKREDFLRTDDDNDNGILSSAGFFKNEEEMGFNVYTNPLEMHRYFEAQLNSALRTFGIPPSFEFGFSEPENNTLPYFLKPSERQPLPEGDLRDQYLKPGFQNPHSKIQDRTDNDLDGKIKSGDLDSVFSGNNRELRPYENPKIHTFGEVISKMFTAHNGIIESHQTVRDNQGNEETIITHKRGDQEYTKTIKVGRDGKKEIHENFVNMSEMDLENFLGNRNIPQIRDTPRTNIDIKHPNWFPFDKYFK